MYQRVYFSDFSDFVQAFAAHDRQSQFSHEALRLLFDYIEEEEDDNGKGTELDVIALCCEYSEDTVKEIADSYGIDIADCEDDSEKTDTVREYLEENTSIVGETSDGFFYLLF